MSTYKEYLERLKSLTDGEFKKYKGDSGGDFETRKQYARDFIYNLTP